MKRWVFFSAFVMFTLVAEGQKNYATSSILAQGKWIKISTEGQGIFKVTGAFLNQAGFSTPLVSSSIRFYGNGGEILPESNSGPATDDLQEYEIEMVDGGDNRFDKEDYFLFYAPGSSRWKYNEGKKVFEFKKNAYSNLSFFFINVGDGAGARMKTKTPVGLATIETDVYTAHTRLEVDSFNFLNSGREWYGEGFGNGYPVSRVYRLEEDGVIPGSRFMLISDIAGRSFGSPNKMTVSVNGQVVVNHTTPPSLGTLLEPIANEHRQAGEAILDGKGISVRYDFIPGSTNAQAWLNWIEVIYRKKIIQINDSLLTFRDPTVVAAGGTAAYVVYSNNAALSVWEVTDVNRCKKIRTEFVNNRHRFLDDATVLREYISFDPRLAKSPVLLGAVSNQNLHGEGFYDMIIVADKQMLGEAKRLAQFRQSQSGLRVLVTDPETIYHEFSSGSTDPSAIRNFIKMFYDRAGTNAGNRPRYLLLFGATSYKFKELSSEKRNLIPTYQSPVSLDPLSSYMSDDYFGFLDDHEDINAGINLPNLDIAVGRIPARTAAQAKVAVDKIINYQTKSEFGAWRKEITLVADDEDFDLHFLDAEAHAATLSENQPVLDLEKIYLDAYQQSSGAGGSRYPDVNASITQQMNAGTLVWNYSGHGGNTRLAQEAILEKDMIAGWNNQDRLPLFITATCDFAPFDNPAQFSIGEDLLLGRSNGAIALMTTTRLVFASSNKLMNNNFLKTLVQKNQAGRYSTIGDAWKEAKNLTTNQSGDFINARKFAMLGDPSMKLLMPEYNVRTTRVLDVKTGLSADTLSALNRYRIEGEVLQPDGVIASGFSGTVDVKVLDKPTRKRTLANDLQSSIREFQIYDNIIYHGKARVVSGKFSAEFIVPNDIRLDYGEARISYYAEDGKIDAQGFDQSIVTGGFGGQAIDDKTGPAITVYLENEQFKNGGIVRETPLLLAKIADQSGIYLGRYGIGHDIRLVIDGDYAKPLILNDFFVPTIEENKAGWILFQMPKLAEGKHRLELRAWDVFNNSSLGQIDFVVMPQKTVDIERFVNFPNPFGQSTVFSIQFNGPVNGSRIDIDILTTEGKVVKHLTETINQDGIRFMEIKWNGLDEMGKKPQPGILLCRLNIKTKNGHISTKVLKLILL